MDIIFLEKIKHKSIKKEYNRIKIIKINYLKKNEINRFFLTYNKLGEKK